MNLTTLTHGEPWMTPHEHDLNREFIRATTDYLASRNVPETPLITLRVNDVIVTWLLARRLETALTPPEDGPAPCPTLAQAGAIGKCRDRLRRAIKELEASFPGNTPKESGTGVPPVIVSDPGNTPRESGTGVPPVIVPDPGTTPRESGTGVPPVIASNPDARDPTTRPRLRNPPETNPDNDSGLVLTWTEHEREPHGWRTWW